MNLDQFVTDAIQTESRIEKVTINPKVFTHVATAIVALGSILDQMKKHIFYKKPYNVSQLNDHLNNADQAIHNLKHEFVHDWPRTPKEKPLEVNPRYFHAIVGTVTEAVELLEILNLNTSEIDTVNLLEEFSDINWYQAIGIDEAGGTFDQVLNNVIAKLRARFPNKFNNEDAINRNLEIERAILEGNPRSAIDEMEIKMFGGTDNQ